MTSSCAPATRAGTTKSLAVLVPAEWIYRTWASGTTEAPDAFCLRIWIGLHANPGFETYVGWLRSDLDECGPTLDERRQR